MKILKAFENWKSDFFRNSSEEAPTNRIPRSNDPTAHPVLYHYCSNSTFLSIIQNKEFWMSDINTMNDYAEVHWAYSQFEKAANLTLKDVGREFIERFDLRLSQTQLHILPFISCLSTEGDVLSQWRAYADNGQGVALGFDALEIEKLSIRSAKIEYDEEAQVDHFVAYLRATHEAYHQLPAQEQTDFLNYAGSMAGVDLACFKNPAFKEEQEVRLIRAVNVHPDSNGLTIKDSGGNGFDKLSRTPQPVKYRASGDGKGIVAYIAMPFSGLGSKAIREVIVGPRSSCNGNEIIAALRSCGLSEAEVRLSEATYR